ncbi:hypothetical protein [Morganella morganii]|uniref:hypothetical protein n=1 Tax=Morganella morganii TaxID=582 RepID=UPI000D8E2A73|nr:hypothetical protein [Morganella morganii]SPX71964.1 Uncharacterised protein [Morganella morganii]SPX93992.1 Uncharacterised protein [Morganella morganii]
MKNTIPKMTDPLGRYYDQPSADNILIDDTHAVITRRDFDLLANYSYSIPSGVYPGKMWKAITSDGTAYLRWFGIAPGRDDVCTNNQRKILIAEE